MSVVSQNANASEVEAANWFFENSLDLFVVLRDGAAVRVNRAFTAVTGWTADEVVGRPLTERIHPSDRKLVSRRLDTLANPARTTRLARRFGEGNVGGAWSTEHRLQKKGGGWLWVRCRAKGGADGAVLAVLQDITEERQRRLESEAAQRSGELLRTAAGISVWRYKPDDKQFIFGLDVANPDEQSHGADLQGAAAVQSAIHPEDARIVNDDWEHTLKTGEVRVCEYRNRREGDESWRRLRSAWRGMRPMASGRFEVLGITQDITELAEARDAALQGEQAAQHAAETQSQFLANMSHEIRTPMNGVLGVLHLLKKEQQLSTDGRGLLDEALACGSMLAELLNDVIDFAKIEAGKLDLSPEPIDMAGALEGVAGMLRPQAEAKGLWLRTVVAADVAWASVDPVRLRQMLFNLIGNAVKFTLTGGVEARMTVRGEGALQRLRVEIEDTGIGISPDSQRRLFDRFSQADGSTTRKFGGSGLGLAISRKLAEIMSGEVGLDSTVGYGSTFWFEIAAPVSNAQSALVEDDTQWLAGMRILVVEDNPTNRLIATKMIENLGGAVSIACDGAEGVEAARTGGFDLIFMDIQMPVMDGVEATRAIRALPEPVGRTPIVAMTANAMSHQRQSYRDAGMDGSVAKPLSPAALLTELAKLIEPAEPEEEAEPFYLEA
ncbi:ATP-binding protein [soil metagenome]